MSTQAIESKSQLGDLKRPERAPLDDLFQQLFTDHRRDLPRYEDDPHSIHIAGAYHLRCSQYIGESEPHPSTGFSPLDGISALIRNERRLILRANAGMGKSTLCIMLAQRLESLGLDKMVILEPTTTIANQLGADFVAAGVNAPVLDNQARQADILGAQSSAIAVVCYDSLSKIGPDWINSRTLIVVDEFHQLVTDVNYRNKKAFNYALDTITQGGRTLMLSATPFDLFTLPDSYNVHFGYKLAMFEADIQQSIKVQPVVYSGRMKDAPSHVINRAESGGGMTCIKYDSIKNLKTAKQLAITKGLNCEYFCSSERAHKEGNKDYQSLVKTGLLYNKLDVLLYTTLLEAGVSIKDPVKESVLVDVNEWRRAVQLMSRPRFNSKTGVNKSQLVYIYRSAANVRLRESEQREQTATMQTRFRYLTMRAGELCEYKNGHIKQGQLSTPVSTDTAKERNLTIEVNEQEGPTHKVNTLWILHELHQQAERVPFSLMLKRLKRFDNRITLIPACTTEIPRCAVTEAHRGRIKQQAEAEAERMAGILHKHFNNMLAVCINGSRSNEWKNLYKQAYPKAAKITRRDIQDFKTKHNISSTKTVRKLIDQYHLITGDNPTLSASNVLRFVCSSEGGEVADYCDQLQAHRRRFYHRAAPKDIDPNSKFFAEREAAVLKKLQILYRDQSNGKGKEWRSKTDWAKIVNRAMAEHSKKLGKLSEGKAMAIVKHLYDTETKRFKIKGKKTSLTKLMNRREFVGLDKLLPNKKSDVIEGTLLGGSDK